MRVSIDVIWLKADGLLVALQRSFTCSVETRRHIAFTTIARRAFRDSQFSLPVVAL